MDSRCDASGPSDGSNYKNYSQRSILPQGYSLRAGILFQFHSEPREHVSCFLIKNERSCYSTVCFSPCIFGCR